MHHRRCTDTPTSSPLLFLRLHASRSSGRGERRGAKRQDKAANSGEKISFSLLSLESNLLVFQNFALLDFQEPLTLATRLLYVNEEENS